MIIGAKYVKTVKVTDPDTGNEVAIQIMKLETGGMVGLDESFLENTDEPVYSPYDVGVQISEDEL